MVHGSRRRKSCNKPSECSRGIKNDNFLFAEPCNTPGATCWSRRGCSDCLRMLCHFSRALDAATGEPDYEMLWQRE